MSRPLPRRRSPLFAVSVVLGLCLAGCAAVLSLDDFAVGTGNPGGSDGSIDGSNTGGDAGDDGAVTCNVDLTTTCFPCEPKANDEFLNQCTDGQCIQFDKSRLASLVLPDGGLPPVTAPDGG